MDLQTLKAQFAVEFLDLPAAAGVDGARWEPFQIELLNNSSRFGIDVKARQIAWSFTAALDAVADACTSSAPRPYIFVSINQDEAKEKIRYVRAVLEALDQPVRPRLRHDSQTEIELASGARFISHPCRPPRGKAGARVYLDEMAHYPAEMDREIYRAALPATTPWSSWEQVRQVREDLREHRFLFLRRPEKLTAEEQQQLDALLTSPIRPQLTAVRTFLVDWYRLWHTAAGKRRTLEAAQARYQAWRSNADYQAVPVLRRLLDQVTAERFSHLSQFLRQTQRDATNNGAERAGRAFRHRQAPHFNLRSSGTIAGALVVAACKQKEAATRIAAGVSHCSRGRKPRVAMKQAA